jgi:hypothetical protein
MAAATDTLSESTAPGAWGIATASSMLARARSLSPASSAPSTNAIAPVRSLSHIDLVADGVAPTIRISVFSSQEESSSQVVTADGTEKTAPVDVRRTLGL